MSQKERENFYRHSILIVDYTKDGLADLIEVDVRNNYLSFEDFINRNQHEIFHLCYNRGRCCQCTPGYILPHNRIIYPAQLELLLDKHGSTLPCHNMHRRAEFCCCKAKPGVTMTVLDVTLARCILINFCRDVFWNSCLTKIGVTLEDFLNKNKHDLYHLFIGNQPCCQCSTGYKYPVHQKMINQNDWKLIFGAAHIPCAIHTIPSTGVPYVCFVSATTGISVNHLSPSLSSIILENFCSLRQAVDILIQSRNSIYGHANEAKISDSDFAAYWSTTEKALLEISKTCSKERETKQKLDDLQKRCLDETLLEQYKIKILEQKQMENTIQEYIEEKTEEIKDNVKKVEEKIEKILQLIENVPKKFTKDQEIQRRRIIEYTKARIQVHVDEKTYVSTNTEKIAMTSIQNTGMVVIVGPPGVGKSQMGLDLMRQYSELHTNYHCLQIDNIMEWNDIVDVDDNCIILCDDIFGKTNCNYNVDDHSRIIDTMHTCVKSGHVNLIVTMRDSIQRTCDHLFTRHALYKDTQFLNIGAEYKMSKSEKRKCLINHLRKHSIEVIVDLSEEQMSCETQSEKGFVHTKTIDEIISLIPNSILGFPESCFLFASNKKFLKFGADFFKRANEILCQTICDLRKRGQRDRQCMVDYTVLIYVLVNGDKLELNKIDIESLRELCKITYPDSQNNLASYEVEDAITRLCGHMLKETKPKIYAFQHQSTFEAVLLSCRHLNQSEKIQLMDYKFILKFARSDGYKGLEGEVFVNIHKMWYKDLAYKLLFKLSQMPSFNSYSNVQEMMSCQICLLGGLDIIKELCDNYYQLGLKEDVGFHVIRSKSFNTLIVTKHFDLSVAILIYTSDNDVVQYLLNIIDRKLSSRNFPKDLLSSLFILLCHTKSDYKARKVWKLIKSHQIYITDEGFVPPVGWDLIVKDILTCKFICKIVDYKLLDLKTIIKTACCLGELESVKVLLESLDHSLIDVKVEMTNACCIGNVELVTLFLEIFDHSLFDVNEAMYNACQRGKVGIAKLLLETFDNSLFGVENAMNNACKIGKVKLVKLLLETFDHSRFDGNEAMNMGCYSGKVELVKLLFDTFDHRMFGVENAMNNACKIGKVKLVKLLLETFDHSRFDGNEAMNMGCYSGKVELVKLLFDTFDHRMFDGEKALNNACENDDVELVKLLFATFDNSMFDVRKVINNACTGGGVKLVTLLLETFDHSLFDANEALNIACERGNAALVMLLFETCCCHSLFFIKHAKEAMKKACKSGELELVSVLLVKFDHCLFDMKKEMIYACKRGKVELVKLLLETFDHSMFDVKMSMNFACYSSNVELVMLLLETFDHSMFDVKEAMNYACKIGKVELVKLLLETFDHSLFDVKKAMNYTCTRGKVKLVKLLLNTCHHGLFDMRIAMNKSCKSGEVEVVKLLLETVDHSLFDAKEAILKACEMHRVQVAKLLLEKFDQELVNVNTALQNVKGIDDKELVRVLQEIIGMLHLSLHLPT